jgi:hypothetical protein
MISNSRFPYWTTWKHTIGGRFGDSAAVDGWGCARCTTITSQASVNRFLDREFVRRLAETTLRSYAMDLLHFLRWWVSVNHTDAINEGALSATVLLDYLRFQAGYHPQPAAATINRRVGVVERALRNEFPDTVNPFAPRV